MVGTLRFAHPTALQTTTASVRGADGGRVLHRIAFRDRDVMWELFIKWHDLIRKPVSTFRDHA
jgi:hypothetical protein